VDGVVEPRRATGSAPSASGITATTWHASVNRTTIRFDKQVQSLGGGPRCSVLCWPWVSRRRASSRTPARSSRARSCATPACRRSSSRSGQGLIQVFGPRLDNYTAASLLAAAIVTLPNFFANTHFVWRITSRENLRSQVLVFWVAVMLGVSLATLFTYLVENTMADQTKLVGGTAVFFVQLLGYGLVWVCRLLVLDRWLFKLAGDTPDHAGEVIGEIPT
jgi:putative flippase GtrA